MSVMFECAFSANRNTLFADISTEYELPLTFKKKSSFSFCLWLAKVMECQMDQNPIIMELRKWIMELHYSFMELHNYGALSPLALHRRFS